MAAIARIIVISAIFYLVRFTLANQHQTQRKYSDSDSTYSLQEDSVSGSEDSNEKVLIRSGVPLRGRTIHQTAWSEEEKITVPGKDTLQQPDNQNAKENLYDGWSLTNVINYILSFIYDTETDDNNVISNNNLAGNSNENLNIPKKNFDKELSHQTSTKINNNKEISENTFEPLEPTFNKGRNLEETANFPSGNLQTRNLEWLRNELSSLSDEYTYSESDTENSEFSNESTDSEYEEESYKHQDYDNIEYLEPNIIHMHSLGLVFNDTVDDSMSIANSLTETSEVEREFESIEKGEESEQEIDKNTRKKYQEGDIHSTGNTESDFDQLIMNYNVYDKNTLQNTDRHSKQQSKSETTKRFKNTVNCSQHKKSPVESLPVKDITTQKLKKQDAMHGSKSYDKDNGENIYATTEKNTIKNKIIEIPPTTSSPHNQRQPQTKELSSKSDYPYQPEKLKTIIDESNLEEKREVNRPFVTNENFNELQRQTMFRNPNNVTTTTVKYAGRAQKKNQFKIPSASNIKNNKIASNTNKKSVVPHIKPSQFPSLKPLKDRPQKYLKPKQIYWSDIYLDLEPDKDVRSYNYLLDSYEFIRIDNNSNKINKKHEDSTFVIMQDKDYGRRKETSTIFPAPLTPSKGQSESENIDKSHDTYDTFLEYLYKNSNSSFILSLRENNSSVV